MISLLQAVVGFIIILITIGGLLYMFYSRSNAVEKAGSGAIIMLAIVSLMIPVFWILESNNQAQAQQQQVDYAVQQGMKLYAQYCTDNCYGIRNGKVVNPKYNGFTFDQLNKMKDEDIARIIAGGVFAAGAQQPANLNLLVRSQRYGGQLTDNDVNYLVQFIRSANSRNSGLTQLPQYLQSNSPSAYATAQALGSATVGQFGQAVDMTKEKNVTINIVQTSSTHQCDSGCYETLNVKVKVGTVITWVNKSNVGHTVSAIEGTNVGSPKVAKQIFDSGIGNLIQTGQKFTWTVTPQSYTFNSNHVVVYYCQVHPNYMFAELTIVQ